MTTFRSSARRRRVPGLLPGLALGFFLAAMPALAQPDWEKVEITATKLTDSLYMLQGAGGNLGLSVGEDGAFLIDDQYAPLSAKIAAAVAKITPEPVSFVVNTHWHGDHTGGNESLGEGGALIVAHDNVRRRLAAGGVVEFFGMKSDPAPAAALPVVTFADAVTLHLNGDEIHVYHVPSAHTDGDAVIHFRTANVVHMGDLFFHGTYPFIDLSSGGAVDGVIAGVAGVLEKVDEETKIIPGHGPLADREDLVAYHAMLTGIRDAVAAQIAAGASLEEIKAAKPTAPWDEAMAAGFIPPDAMVDFVHGSLTQSED